MNRLNNKAEILSPSVDSEQKSRLSASLLRNSVSTFHPFNAGKRLIYFSTQIVCECGPDGNG